MEQSHERDTDDIRATAERIMEKASGEDELLYEYIIAVLMDERERCYRIADELDDRSPGNPAAEVARRIHSPDMTPNDGDSAT